MMTGLVLLVFAGFGGIAWYAYQEAQILLQGEPRLVRAPQGPYRVRPTDPGGLPVLNEEAPIVSVLSGAEEPPKVERILPREEPVARSGEELLPPPETPQPGIAGEGRQPTGRPAAGKGGLEENGLAAAPVAATSEAPPEVAEAEGGQPARGEASAAPEEPGRRTSVMPMPPPPRLVAKPADDARLALAAPEPAAGPAGGSSRAPGSNSSEATPPLIARRSEQAPAPAGASEAGIFRIQLAAVSSRAAATRAWQRYRRRMGPLLRGLSPTIRVVRADRGTLYRLQAGDFPTREAARIACCHIREAGGDCFVLEAAP